MAGGLAVMATRGINLPTAVSSREVVHLGLLTGGEVSSVEDSK